MKKVTVVFLVGFMFITNAFGLDTEPFPLSGKIVFACTDKICTLDLAKRTLLRLTYEPSPTEVFQTAKINAHQMLLSTCWKDKGCSIAKIDPNKENRISTMINNAICPVYLPATQKLLYYGFKMAPDKTIQWKLYAADYADGVLTEEGQTAISGDSTELLIPISKNEVAFNGGKLFYGTNANDAVWLYDTDRKNFSKTNIEYCIPLIWRSVTKQLLCVSRERNDFFYLTNIDGKNRRQIKFFADREMHKLYVIPVLYIPQYDVLILSVYDKKSSTPSLWAYDFKTEKKQRLMPGFAINLGDGIYFEN